MTVQLIGERKYEVQLTSVNVLSSPSRQCALVCLLHRLRPKLRACYIALSIHCLLKAISLPAKDIVSVLSVSSSTQLVSTWTLKVSLRGVVSLCSPVTHAKNKRLSAIRRPETLVVELAGIPYRLVHQLRNGDAITR